VTLTSYVVTSRPDSDFIDMDAARNNKKKMLALLSTPKSANRKMRHRRCRLLVCGRTDHASGHDKMRSRADLRGASPLVSFNHVIDPHFIAFSSSLYTTVCNHKPNHNPSLTLILTLTLTLTLTQT